jgi:hypothetical protein
MILEGLKDEGGVAARFWLQVPETSTQTCETHQVGCIMSNITFGYERRLGEEVAVACSRLSSVILLVELWT